MSKDEFQDEGDLTENNDNDGQSDNEENLGDNDQGEDQEGESIGKSALTYYFVILITVFLLDRSFNSSLPNS